jgi:hydrogenase maturation factor
MKYVDEFRNRTVATALEERIKKIVRQSWTVMEICG